jgi:hypothetical protein
MAPAMSAADKRRLSLCCIAYLLVWFLYVKRVRAI